MKPSFFKSIFLSLIFTILFLVILLLTSALILSKLNDPEKYTDLFSNISLFVSIFIGGVILNKKETNNFVISSLFSLTISGILLIISSLYKSFDEISIIKIILVFIISFAPFFMNSNVNKPKKNTKKITKKYFKST